MTAALTAFTLRYDQRPWTLNVERQGNRWKRADLVREWRKAFAVLAKAEKIPQLERVFVLASPEVATRRSIPDTGACIGAAKAAIDGLVDAGVLDGDGPDRVLLLAFSAPIVTGRDALVVHVIDASTTDATCADDVERYLRSVS